MKGAAFDLFLSKTNCKCRQEFSLLRRPLLLYPVDVIPHARTVIKFMHVNYGNECVVFSYMYRNSNCMMSDGE
jgi:hypothetical protein